MSTNSKLEMGSARGPRAGLGGPPKPSCPSANRFGGTEKLVERGFRRAVENCMPAACAAHAAAAVGALDPRRAGSPPAQAGSLCHPPKFRSSR